MSCEQTTIKTHIGGNVPTLQFTLQNSDETAKDITGKTITFPLYKKTVGGGRTLVSSNAMTVTDGEAGECEITLASTDVSVATTLDGYVKIDHGGGSFEILPSSGSIKIVVSAL